MSEAPARRPLPAFSYHFSLKSGLNYIHGSDNVYIRFEFAKIREHAILEGLGSLLEPDGGNHAGASIGDGRRSSRP